MLLRPQSSNSVIQLCTKIKNLSSAGKWQHVFSYYREIKSNQQTHLMEPPFLHLILKSCLYLTPKHALSLHASLIKDGLDTYTSTYNSILNLYTKSQNICLARRVFDRLNSRDSVSWNVIINGYFDQSILEEGMRLYKEARIENFVPNTATLVLLIQACRSIGATEEGMKLHGYMIRGGYMAIVSVQNSFLNFYADTEMKSAQKLFNEMCDRDLISWSAMVGGYVQSEKPEVALQLFREIVSLNEISVDAQLTANVIKVSIRMKELCIGKMIHGVVISRGFHDDVFVGNSLIDTYSKCYDTEAASRVFMEMSERNIVSYNSLMSGFVGNDKFLEALDVFATMQRAKIQADEVTMINLLQTSKHFVHSIYCKCIHSMMLRLGHEYNELVINSLIDAYAKCSLITLAWELFNQIEKRDTVTWTTMIAGFTSCGMPGKAITLFQEMNERPNTVTIINLIEACSVLAELKRSKSAHAVAVRNHVATEVAVGTAILDMYSKCGAIDTCERVFKHQIPIKNIISWSAMISAYGMNGLPHKALALVGKMKSHRLKPNPVTTLAVLSSCSHGGLIKEGLLYFTELVRNNDGVKLGLEHYSCIVDLLARAGKLNSAMDLIKEMSSHGFDPGPSAWGAFLSACRRNYGNGDNFEIGADAVSHILELEPCNSGGYMLASGMYAAGGSWMDAARMRRLVRERGVRVAAGYSLVHVNGSAIRFVAGEKQNHYLSGDVFGVSRQLHSSLEMDNLQDWAFLQAL